MVREVHTRNHKTASTVRVPTLLTTSRYSPNGGSSLVVTEVHTPSGVPRNFVRGGGSTNSVEDKGQTERGSGGGSPLVRGSGGSCNLVQEISFHIVTLS